MVLGVVDGDAPLDNVCVTVIVGVRERDVLCEIVGVRERVGLALRVWDTDDPVVADCVTVFTWVAVLLIEYVLTMPARASVTAAEFSVTAAFMLSPAPISVAPVSSVT
jgi:hypothetical protein